MTENSKLANSREREISPGLGEGGNFIVAYVISVRGLADPQGLLNADRRTKSLENFPRTIPRIEPGTSSALNVNGHWLW